MKDSSEPARSPLGYLAAFTLGIICMGAIVFFTQYPRSHQTDDRKMDDLAPADSEPQRIHFQRTNLPSGLRESLDLPTAPARAMPEPRRPQVQPVVYPETEPDAAASQHYIIDEPLLPPRPAVVAVPLPVAGDARPGGARIPGRAHLMFKPPAEVRLPLDPMCAAKHQGPVTTRHFVAGPDGQLADVLVVVTGGLPPERWRPPQQPASLRINGCIYENHILAVQTGQKVRVSNLDRTIHNIHIIPQRNSESNALLMPGRRPLEYTFEEPELFIRFKCDVHPWEFAYVSVIEHPFFAVTDRNGNFAITGLPAGQYTIEAHHHKAGILRREIVLEDHRNATVDFQFHQLQAQAAKL